MNFTDNLLHNQNYIISKEEINQIYNSFDIKIFKNVSYGENFIYNSYFDWKVVLLSRLFTKTLTILMFVLIGAAFSLILYYIFSYITFIILSIFLLFLLSQSPLKEYKKNRNFFIIIKHNHKFSWKASCEFNKQNNWIFMNEQYSIVDKRLNR